MNPPPVWIRTSKSTVSEVLRDKARQGGTVVMVLHDLDLAARFCDQLLLLHNNQVLSHGSPR